MSKPLKKLKSFNFMRSFSDRTIFNDGRPCKTEKFWGFRAFLKAPWTFFKEFSNNSSIHGIKYVTDPRRHWSEKLFWIVAFFVSVCGCSYLIRNTYRKSQTTPLIVSFSEKFINIWEIPFPAITICPGTYGSSDGDWIPDNFQSENDFENLTWISNVYFRGKNNDSDIFFKRIITEEGYCWVFNTYNFNDMYHENVLHEAFLETESLQNLSADWTLEDGYSNKGSEAYPYRPAGSGDDGGLTFEISKTVANVEETFNRGFKLAVHLPSEIPQFRKPFYRIPISKSSVLTLTPTLIVTEDLKHYGVDKRQCYLENEKIQKIFKTYTRMNCQTECVVEKTLEKCKCVPFYMPRTNGTGLCNKSKENCVKNTRKDFLQSNMENSLKTSKRYDDRGSLACGCLPPCTSLSFSGAVSFDDVKDESRINGSLKSFISVVFLDDDFIYFRRSELYTSTDFIANFGGILGLFLGVSILSIVEFIYFLFIHRVEVRIDSRMFRNLTKVSEKIVKEETEK